jgi:hypothetical protein
LKSVGAAETFFVEPPAAAAFGRPIGVLSSADGTSMYRSLFPAELSGFKDIGGNPVNPLLILTILSSDIVFE